MWLFSSLKGIASALLPELNRASSQKADGQQTRHSRAPSPMKQLSKRFVCFMIDAKQNRKPNRKVFLAPECSSLSQLSFKFEFLGHFDSVVFICLVSVGKIDGRAFA